MLDYSADTNSISNFSSDREFGAGSERDFETQPYLEPSAPYMPPSPTTAEAQPLSSSYENLYKGIPVEGQIPMEPVSAKDLDIGDRFDSRQTEPHLQGLGRRSSYEELYAAGLPPEDTALAREGESAGPAASDFLPHDCFFFESQNLAALYASSVAPSAVK